MITVVVKQLNLIVFTATTAETAPHLTRLVRFLLAVCVAIYWRIAQPATVNSSYFLAL
jgi:hypothetical protein